MPASPASAVVSNANDPGAGTRANTRMQPLFPMAGPHASALPGEVPRRAIQKPNYWGDIANTRFRDLPRWPLEFRFEITA